MAKKCSIFAHCRNSKGEVVRSKLFQDLLHYTSNNRKITNEYYGIGTNSEFIDEVRDKVEFDENGEITFESLKEVTDLDIKEEKVLEILNKDIGSGIYEYETALNKLQEFNRNNPYRKTHIATIRHNTGGRYQLYVTKRTSEEESKLEDAIYKKNFRDSLVARLREAGVGVDFIENDENSYNGRYSTENIDKSVDGLYHLIQVAKGEKVDETLAEESGHFIVGSLGNHTLIQRLLKNITPEVAKTVLGDSYDGNLSTDIKREVAGQLVGQSLMNKVESTNPLKSLLERIVTTAKKIFYRLSGNGIKADLINARNTASKIARGFMTNTIQDSTLENALATKETMYSITNTAITKRVAALKKIDSQLKTLVSKTYNIDRDTANQYKLLRERINNNLSFASKGLDFISAPLALSGIATAISNIKSLMEFDIPEVLNSIDTKSIKSIREHQLENINKLRILHDLVKYINSVYNTVKELQISHEENVEIINDFGFNETIDFPAILSSIEGVLLPVTHNITRKEKEISLAVLEEFYGSKYVTRGARIVFNKNRRQKLSKEELSKLSPEAQAAYKEGRKWTRLQEEEQLSLEDLLSELDSDIGWWDAHFGSMANNPDIISQAVDGVVRQAKREAEMLSYNTQEELRLLQSKLKDLGIKDTRIFYEIDSNGRLTGNIINELNYGDWENDYNKMEEEAKKAFRKEHEDIYKPGTNELKDNLKVNEVKFALKWSEFFKAEEKKFHKLHSTFNNESGRYIPNNTYKNGKYTELLNKYDGLESWLKEFNSLREKVYSALPEGSMPSYRLPQFKGRTVDAIKNRKLFESTNKAIRHSIGENIRETFCEDSEDIDYGSDLYYNEEGECVIDNKGDLEKEKINRLPLFGINKLKDTSYLSTDIFHSMFAFSSMAFNYQALKTVSGFAETIKSTMQNRTVGNTEGLTSKVYGRFLKFLDKQVYGINTPKKRFWGTRVVINKLLDLMGRTASALTLGGNVHGGIINLGTGMIEIHKEAAAGEYFDVADLFKAEGIFTKSMGKMLVDYGVDNKNDKLSLFIRHYDILSENQKISRDWYTRDSRGRNIAESLLYLPYSTGDIIMQTLPFLAMAQKVELYDTDGNKTNLYDAYTLKDIKDEKTGKVVGKRLVLNGLYFKDKEGSGNYKQSVSILDKIDNKSITNKNDFTKEEIEFLVNKLNIPEYDLSNIEDVKASLLNYQNVLTWTSDDDNKFQTKARTLTNKLHGIYNEQDKAAITQNMYFKMLTAMKGYMFGMVERRFGSGKYSAALDKDYVEGSFITFGKYMTNLLDNLTNKEFKNSLKLIGAMLYSRGSNMEFLKNQGFAKNQIHNLRRVMADFVALALLMMTRALLAPPEDDEDDEYKSTFEGIMYYTVSRLYVEQQAYTTSRGLSEEYINVFDPMPIGLGVTGDLINMIILALGTPFADESDSKYYYQRGRYKDMPKYKIKLYKKIPYYKTVITWEDGYEAFESFEYGRNTK